MKKLFLITGLTLITGLLSAQKDFRPGYIIDYKDDTIPGKIDYRKDNIMNNTCLFKSMDNTEKALTPVDIKAFRFIDSKYFVSREVNGKKIFLEYLVKGKVSIYYMHFDNTDHYYIEKDNQPLTEIPYDEGYTIKDGKEVYYETKTHKGVLVYYMTDAPQIQEDINSMGRPDHDNLIRLAKEYQDLTCKDEKCIVYEKKMPQVKCTFEPKFGVSWLKHADNISYDYGCDLYVRATRSNERLYLRTGILYSHLYTDNRNIDFFRFPIQLEYVLPLKAVKPKVGLGYIFFPTDIFSRIDNIKYEEVAVAAFCLNAGVDIKLTDKLDLSITGTTESYPLIRSLLTDSDFSILGYSVDIGVIFKL